MHTPGNNANIFGNVLPIQNGRWDCVQVSKVHRNPVGLPNQRDTARRTRIRPKALIVASTSRTTRCRLSRRLGREQETPYYSPITWRSIFESTSSKAAAILMMGADTQASKTLPMNVLGTAPGNILWSYSIITNFRKKEDLQINIITHTLKGVWANAIH